jgi:CheY-like chemotaxis protein
MEIVFRSAPSTSEAGLTPETVLIVDDDRAVLNGLSELLENEGYAVATAMDGVDALIQLRAGLRPCAILLDLMMPRMDGWDFRHEQLEDPELRDLPVVVITAAGFSETSIKAQFGDIELVAKPPSEDGLLDAIRRCSGDPSH